MRGPLVIMKAHDCTSLVAGVVGVFPFRIFLP